MTVFTDFCRILACALAMGRREEEYLQVAKNYSRDELSDISLGLSLLIREMERSPFTDLLGPFYIECAAHSSKRARGEFYTPPDVSKLMARMLFDVDAVVAAGKPVSLVEPACGSGGMILALAELFAPHSVDLLRVTAQDINPVAADMAYINLTLWGVPAKIVLDDTIRMTATHECKNVHWFRVGEESRLMAEKLLELAGGLDQSTPVVDLGQIRSPFEEKDGQFMFDF